MILDSDDIFSVDKLKNYLYVKISNTHSTYIHICKTRPNLVVAKEDNYKVYRFKKIYRVNDIYLTNDLFQQAIQRANEKNNHHYSIPDISNYEILYQLLLKHKGDGSLVDKFFIINNTYYFSDRLAKYKDTFKDLFFVYLDDLEEVKILNKSEKIYLENKNKKQAETKIITKLMKNTIETICNQYGMTLKDNRIMFKDYKGLMDFYNIALNETIVKGLTENGFTITRKNNKRKIGISTTLFTLEDLGLEYAIETDKN